MLCEKAFISNRFEEFGKFEDILGEDMSCTHGSIAVTRNPSAGLIYAVMEGTPCV